MSSHAPLTTGLSLPMFQARLSRLLVTHGCCTLQPQRQGGRRFLESCPRTPQSPCLTIHFRLSAMCRLSFHPPPKQSLSMTDTRGVFLAWAAEEARVEALFASPQDVSHGALFLAAVPPHLFVDWVVTSCRLLRLACCWLRTLV